MIISSQYGISFQIDKIENFSKYFPHYNFDCYKKRQNEKIDSFLENQKKPKKEIAKNFEIDSKILAAKSNIKNKLSNFNLEKQQANHKFHLLNINEKIKSTLDDINLDLEKPKKLDNGFDLKDKRQKSDRSENENNDYNKILSQLDLNKIEEWLQKKKYSSIHQNP